jgi:hypothetical protein
VECNPDYTDPTAYLEAMAWAKEQDWWPEFLSTIQRYGHKVCIGYNRFDYYIRTDFLDPSVGAPKLASYIEGRER